MSTNKFHPKRLEQIEALRGIAFLGVFLSHTGIVCFGAAGHWGVSIFLVLSGFMMMYSYYDKNRITQSGFFYCIQFSAHKIRKLYPLHILTMLSMAAFWFVGGGECIQIDVLKFILNVFLIQEWFPIKNVSINGVSWYLVTAAFCYFIFPKVLRVLENIKDIKKVFCALLILLILQVILDKMISRLPKLLPNDLFLSDISEWLIYFFPLTRSLDFIMGVFTGYLCLNNYSRKQFNNILANKLPHVCLNKWILLSIIILANVICVYFERYVLNLKGEATGRYIWWTYSVPFTFSSCALIYHMVREPMNFESLMVNKVTLFLGRISSTAFLIHYVVFQYIKSFLCYFISRGFYNEYGSLIKLIIGFIITIMVALIWERIESGCFTNQGK